MASIFEEIANRIDYSALYSEYLRLKRRGNRLTALCPFHQEKAPSFYVDARTGLWHCFGCKEGGNVFQFIAKIENLEMRDVVELLARKYGVDITRFSEEKQREKITKRQFYLKILSLSAKFYTNELFSTTHGQRCLSYLRSRGLKDSIIKKFSLGVTPKDIAGLTKMLLEKNVKLEVLKELGLSIASRGTAEPIDFFRNRIIFPLFNMRGEIVSFAGRTLTEEEPKYLNTSNTPIYNKSRLLFGMNFARNSISEVDSVFIVEGYIDVIMLHQSGIFNAVATCGTALTTDHLRELSRYTDNIVLAYDGDSAGINSALRAGELCLYQGIFPRILLFKEGKDPADVVKEGGKAGFEKFSDFGVATNVSRLLVSLFSKSEEPDDRTLKKVFSEAKRISNAIKDPLTQSIFIKELADALKLSQKSVADILAVGSKTLANSSRVSSRSIRILDVLGKPADSLYSSFFSLVIGKPEYIKQVQVHLRAEDFPKGIFRDAFLAIMEKDFTPSSNKLSDSLKKFFSQIVANRNSNLGYSLEGHIKKIKSLRLEALNQKITAKKRELIKATENNDSAKVSTLRQELEELLLRQKKLRAMIGSTSTKTKADKNEGKVTDRLRTGNV